MVVSVVVVLIFVLEIVVFEGWRNVLLEMVVCNLIDYWVEEKLKWVCFVFLLNCDDVVFLC